MYCCLRFRAKPVQCCPILHFQLTLDVVELPGCRNHTRGYTNDHCAQTGEMTDHVWHIGRKGNIPSLFTKML